MAGADREQLVALLRGTKYARAGGRGVDGLISAARASIALRQGEATLALKVRLLVQQVVVLDEQIAELEAVIRHEFADLGYAARDFPVGTPIALATLVAEAGNVHRFASSKQFVAHFGWCPADTQSRQSRNGHPRLSKAGSRFARRILWMLAIFSVGHASPYRAYFQQRTAAGKSKMDTLIAIGRKLLTTIYAILKTGRPFDPAYAAGS